MDASPSSVKLLKRFLLPAKLLSCNLMPVIVTCENCGVSFGVPFYRLTSARFCSRSCKTKVVCWTPEAIAKRKLSPPHGRPIGTKNKAPHSQAYREKKRAQRIAFLSQRPGWMQGESNPNWRGGLTSEDRARLSRTSWKKISKRIIERDGCCCVCGTTEKLVAHHKIPWRFSKDDSDSNLVAVCTKHHATLEKQSLDAVHLEAISRFCQQCKRFDSVAVRECGDRLCPLWRHRPFQIKPTKPPVS